MIQLADLIKTGVNTGLLNTYVCYPAIVKSVNVSNQTITAQIAIQRIVDGENQSISVLVGVPLVFPTVQGFHITMPIKADDEVLIVFADRCIDGWWVEGGVKPQATHRVHHISDGFALIGVNSKPNSVSNYSADDLEIRNTEGDQKITLKQNKDINITTTANINVSCVNASVDCSGDARVNCTNATTTASSSWSVTAPANTINGPLNVTGTITAPTISASTSLTASGVEMTSHVHGGVTPGGSNTLPVS